MSNRYDHQFAVQLTANLGSESAPAATRVVTRLRIMTEETASEAQKEHGQSANSVPQYVFGSGKDLPLHPSLQAMGRHYFSW